MRFQNQIEGGAGRIPDSLAILCDDRKPVAPGRNVGVVRGAPCSRLDPIAIEAFQFVFEEDFVRSLEIDGRVFEFEFASAGAYLRGRTRVRQLSVKHGLLYEHREEPFIDGQFIRIDGNHPFHGWKPEFAVRTFPGRRLKSTVALLAFHAIRAAIGGGLERADRSFREAVEILLADAKDSFVAAHPKVSLFILEDAQNGVVWKAGRG